MKIAKIMSFISLILLASVCHAGDYHQLKLKNVERLSSSPTASTTNEISGVAALDDKALFVTDEKEDHFIFQLNKNPNDKDYKLSTWLDLNDLIFRDPSKGPKYLASEKPSQEEYIERTFADYQKEMKQLTPNTIDLEGMTLCKIDPYHAIIFLINERVRDIIRIDINGLDKTFSLIGKPIQDYIASQPLEQLESVLNIDKSLTGADGNSAEFKIDYTKTPLFGKTVDGKPGAQYDNAGFEGIAADCRNQTLYIAKERQPRYIVKTDFSGNVKDLYTMPESARQYRVVQNPFTATGNFLVEPDVSDLFFLPGDKVQGDRLFALERNTGEIAELNPNNISAEHQMELVARFDYSPWEFIYSEVTKKNLVTPFGMAETLTVEKGRKKTFHIGFDNGGENKLNDKGFAVLGCGHLKDEQNCLQKGALNAVVLTLQEK